MIYDLIIIGAGPAGITAAVYAARKKMQLLVISKDIGGQTAWSADIENYTGYQFISGAELTNKFKEHIDAYDVKVNENEDVQSLVKEENLITVVTNKATYKAKAVIIASGKVSKELGVPGESEFKNKGVTYCATCDGPVFANKKVAVIGGGNSALDAAISLDKIVETVDIINIADSLTGDAVMREQIKNSKKISVYNRCKVTGILGEKFVNAIELDSIDGKKTLPVDGVFIEIGLVPNSNFAKSVKLNDLGEIEINSQNETSIPGIFAAGDVTDVPEKQIIVAAGEGAKATLSVFRYVIKNKNYREEY